MPIARPMFNVKALETGEGYFIEAIWPIGRNGWWAATRALRTLRYGSRNTATHGSR
jgi:hypothetical protein